MEADTAATPPRASVVNADKARERPQHNYQPILESSMRVEFERQFEVRRTVTAPSTPHVKLPSAVASGAHDFRELAEPLPRCDGIGGPISGRSQLYINVWGTWGLGCGIPQVLQVARGGFRKAI